LFSAGRDGGKLKERLEPAMAEFDRLSVLLPPELAQAVRDAVDGERYVVESDVVIDALRDWQTKQQMREAKLRRLRELIDQGTASGSEPMASNEFDRIKQEGRAVLAARKAAE
jgi:antitoxin ParD1/3/4